MANIVIVPTFYTESADQPTPSINVRDLSGAQMIVDHNLSIPPSPFRDIFSDYMLWYRGGDCASASIFYLADCIRDQKFLSLAEFQEALNNHYKGTILVQRVDDSWRFLACNPQEQSISSWFYALPNLYEFKTMSSEIISWLNENIQDGHQMTHSQWHDYRAKSEITVRCRSERDAVLLKLKIG